MMLSTAGSCSYILLLLGWGSLVSGLALANTHKADTTVAHSDKSKTLVTSNVREGREMAEDKVDKDKKKDGVNKIVSTLLQAYINNYRHKDVTGEEEKEDDFFCVSDRDGTVDNGNSIDQADIPSQLFKYLTKYVVKRSYTPFSYIRSGFETFGFINPIGNEIQKKGLSVSEVDPLTTLFFNIQETYNSYEKVEADEEDTKLLNMLSRTGNDAKIKKPAGIINKLWPATKPDAGDDKKGKKCVFKQPEDLWAEIMPYDPYIIIRSLLAAGAWLFAFWVPIFPFIFSFPSRNGGGIFVFDDDDNRRDQQQAFDYYDTNDSQYSSYGGNHVGIHSDNNRAAAQPDHVNYTSQDNHSSYSSHAEYVDQDGIQVHGEASHSRLSDIVKQHIGNSQKLSGTQNVYVSNAKIIDAASEVDSYTHYNHNDLWYSHVSLK